MTESHATAVCPKAMHFVNSSYIFLKTLAFVLSYSYLYLIHSCYVYITFMLCLHNIHSFMLYYATEHRELDFVAALKMDS